jgi:hypothetical protein
MRRDARCRFAGIVSHGVPRLLLVWLRFWSWRRFSNVVSDGVPSFISAKCGVLLERHFERLHDARRWFSYVVSIGFPRPIDANVVSCGGVGFPTSCTMAFRGSPMLHMASFSGVATVSIDFRASFPIASGGHVRWIRHLLEASRRLASDFQRRVQWHPEVHVPNVESCGGVAKTGVSFSTFVQWHPDGQLC